MAKIRATIVSLAFCLATQTSYQRGATVMLLKGDIRDRTVSKDLDWVCLQSHHMRGGEVYQVEVGNKLREVWEGWIWNESVWGNKIDMLKRYGKQQFHQDTYSWCWGNIFGNTTFIMTWALFWYKVLLGIMTACELHKIFLYPRKWIIHLLQEVAKHWKIWKEAAYLREHWIVWSNSNIRCLSCIWCDEHVEPFFLNFLCQGAEKKHSVLLIEKKTNLGWEAIDEDENERSWLTHSILQFLSWL